MTIRDKSLFKESRTQNHGSTQPPLFHAYTCYFGLEPGGFSRPHYCEHKRIIAALAALRHPKARFRANCETMIFNRLKSSTTSPAERFQHGQHVIRFRGERLCLRCKCGFGRPGRRTRDYGDFAALRLGPRHTLDHDPLLSGFAGQRSRDRDFSPAVLLG